LERTKLFVRARRTSHVQDARACSAVLKVRQVGASSEHRAVSSSSTKSGAGQLLPTRSGGTEVSRFRLLQNGREDKCVVSHEEVRSKPTNLLELGDEPTSAPTGMSSHRVIEDHQRCGMDSLERR